MKPALPEPRRPLDCFLLSRQWQDRGGGLQLVYWAVSDHGPVRIVVRREQAVCFVAEDARLPSGVAMAGRKPLKLKNFHGDRVAGLYFDRQRDLNTAREVLRRQGIAVYESDIKPADRFLMERFITAAMTVQGPLTACPGYLQATDPVVKAGHYRPPLRWASIDIETEGLNGALYSIAVTAPGHEQVFMVGQAADSAQVQMRADEAGVLEAFFDWIARYDPDVLLGWNVVNFDLDYLHNKCRALGKEFALGRGGDRAVVLQPDRVRGQRVARIPGRVVLDGIDTLRAAFWRFESFELEAVARALLGRGKHLDAGVDKVEEIHRLFRQDKARLAAYNLEDCRLVADIFAHADLIGFAMRRAELTGLAMDRQGGSVAAFDNLYLPRLHRRGRVAPDVADVDSSGSSPGGYVLDSSPGLYDNVLLLDFKSLYPSIIRTFHIDPLGLHVGLHEPGENPVPGFLGATFARKGAILPAIIEALWQERDRARSADDPSLSQAVKILMNSFYGVLGASGCRFYDPRLASSITRRGHEIIRKSRDLIASKGLQVIYGDTDSLFVLLGREVSETQALATGRELMTELNRWWQRHLRDTMDLESCLEMEFETLFLRFLMPTVRGEATGSKKRYAGMVRNRRGEFELVFKGLESVRTDWTPLARRFQRELYRRVFLKLPFQDYIAHTLKELLEGRVDQELIYRKRLRRPLKRYTRNLPPHVQAARKRKQSTGRWVEYVITAHGPEPVEGALPRPDYDHYRERQLAPAADGILHFLGTSFAQITARQLAFF